jgi:hypothetical protein
MLAASRIVVGGIGVMGNLFLVSLPAQIGVYSGWAHHQLDAGYSIFLGRRKSWPPRP